MDGERDKELFHLLCDGIFLVYVLFLLVHSKINS